MRALFTERDVDTNDMTLRRGFEIKPGETVVVIEDVITTGGSTKEVVRVVEKLGGKVLAAGSIIDRSAGQADVVCRAWLCSRSKRWPINRKIVRFV